jgi:hypothetical protein
MRVPALLLGGLLAASPAVLRGQSLPPIVKAGLDLIVRQQPDSAIAVWTQGWAYAEDTAKRQVLSTSLKALPDLIGRVSSYDSIRVVAITPHLLRAYFLLRCPRQPLYIMMVLYEASDRWTVSYVNWNTAYDRVLPPEIFGAEHPNP